MDINSLFETHYSIYLRVEHHFRIQTEGVLRSLCSAGSTSSVSILWFCLCLQEVAKKHELLHEGLRHCSFGKASFVLPLPSAHAAADVHFDFC